MDRCADLGISASQCLQVHASSDGGMMIFVALFALAICVAVLWRRP